jgi:RNA polymerase sigma-70 factor
MMRRSECGAEVDVGQPASIASIFLEHASVRLEIPADTAELERLLVRAFEAARADWPKVTLSSAQFTSHLARRLPADSEGRPVDEVLSGLHLSDLYLACACAHGVREALDAVDQEHLAKLPGLLRRQRLLSTAIDDACQMLREKLFLRTAQGDPHIATYTGEGKLINWMKVIATRMANKLRSPEGPVAGGRGVSKILDELPGRGDDQEKDAIRQDLRRKLRAATRDALHLATSEEERHLLRLYYADGLSESKLARLFDTSQPTISRRIHRAQDAIRSETKRLLRERHRLTERDLEGLFAELQSRLDITLSQIFRG